MAAALRPETVLVSIMHANNETGVLQPVAELSRITREHGALFHTDAAQSVGKVPVDVTVLGVDLLTLVGHRVYAPKGIAALYIPHGVDLDPLIGGGGQEGGRRSGTENVPYAVALGTAADSAAADLSAGGPGRLKGLRDRLHRELKERLPERVHLNGSGVPRLPQTLNISIEATLGHAVLAACPQIAASTGSACHGGTHRPLPGADRDGIRAAAGAGGAAAEPGAVDHGDRRQHHRGGDRPRLTRAVRRQELDLSEHREL
ncbi:cysteine desulfurase family protein [Kocuria turfanensis]|uniref:cysteine desulfurase family protein n=1 Tax=Kocuria turfanensis TaxID=388357 RepID=UPI004036E4DA